MLLVKLVAGVTTDRRQTGFMTIHAGLHGERRFTGQRLSLHHLTMAVGAIDAGGVVLGMAEDDEVGEPVNSRLRKRLRILRQCGQRLNGRAFSLNLTVAQHALGRCGKSSALRRTRMTVGAAHSRLRMLFVAEAKGLGRRDNT